jgi:hypothetical protein
MKMYMDLSGEHTYTFYIIKICAKSFERVDEASFKIISLKLNIL